MIATPNPCQLRPRAAVPVLLAVLLAACVPTSDGGLVLITTDPRIGEIRAAREALAEPVPLLVAAATTAVAEQEQVWTLVGSSDERAAAAAAVSSVTLEEIVATLAGLELAGEGPDVAAARGLVDELVAAGGALAAGLEAEQQQLAAVASFDATLGAVVVRWDERGSYSAQLQLFADLAAEAGDLAVEAGTRTDVVPCVGVWDRRVDAATTVAERSEEFGVLIRDRRGQQFDELRDTYREDPYGLAGDPWVLDADAGSCWASQSEVAAAAADIEVTVAALEAALDPEDLRDLEPGAPTPSPRAEG